LRQLQPRRIKARSDKRRRPTRFCSPAQLAKALRTLAVQKEALLLTGLVARAVRAALVLAEDLEAAEAQRRSPAREAWVLPLPVDWPAAGAARPD
jgi:hypothetical protein